MKWITHQTGAFAGCLLLGVSAPALLSSLGGAILPDIIDQKLSALAGRKRQKVFNQLHRGSSHWFGWWVGIFLLILLFPMPQVIKDLAMGFALGAISHVLLDMLTPRGVPLLPVFSRLKIAAPVCATGSLTEYVFLAIMGLGCLYLLMDMLKVL